MTHIASHTMVYMYMPCIMHITATVRQRSALHTPTWQVSTPLQVKGDTRHADAKCAAHSPRQIASAVPGLLLDMLLLPPELHTAAGCSPSAAAG